MSLCQACTSINLWQVLRSEITNLYPEREGYEHLANAKQLLTSAQGCKDCHLLLSFVKVTHGPANLGLTVTEDSFESMPIKLSSTRI